MSRREYDISSGEYTDLEYLETNTNQYIDTGRIVHSNTEYWEFDYQPLLVGDRTDYSTAVPGGIYDGSKYWQCNYTVSYGKPRAMWGGSVYDKSMIAAADKYNRVTYKLNSKTLWVNGVQTTLGSSNVVDSTLTMYLFVRHLASGSGRDYTAQNRQRMWRTTVYDLEGNKLAEYLPKLRNSDGKPGMLEVISGTFLVNIGSGEFGYKKMDGTIVAPIKE